MSNTAPPTPRNLHLNTFTRRTSRVTLTLPPATTEELRKQGIEAPADKMLTAGGYMLRLAQEGVLVRVEAPQARDSGRTGLSLIDVMTR